MNKGESLLHLVIGIGAGITTVIFAWNAWLSTYSISLGENVAAINQHLTDMDSKLQSGWTYKYTVNEKATSTISLQ